MSDEAVRKFYRAVMEDDALQEALKARVNDPSVTSLADVVRVGVELGKEAGFEFTAEELEAAVANATVDSRALTDEELEAVAGGEVRATGDYALDADFKNTTINPWMGTSQL